MDTLLLPTDPALFRWVWQRPPCLQAVADDMGSPLPYAKNIAAQAKPFRDIWEGAEGVSAPWVPLVCSTDLDCHLDPDFWRASARSFSVHTSFGTDV